MKILHLEDNPQDAELFRHLLDEEFPQCTVTVVNGREQWFAAIESLAPDLILSDFSMPGFSGREALAIARERLPAVPFIFLSGTIGEERAIEALHGGAHDYVLKDNPARLVPAISRALRDTDGRRQHTEALRRVREQADIIERASEAIVVSDLAGLITHWNRGAERTFGISAAQAIGHLSEELFPGALMPDLRTVREATDLTGEWRGEIQIKTAEDRTIFVELHMTLICDDAGRPKARLSIATDITEKKKTEEQFLRAQRLENIGLLAAGIAHDLNNVLAPVLMAAPLLRTRASDPRDLRILQSLEKSAERGAGLVRQILGFAHGAGTGFRLTQVKHLLKDISDIVQASFPKSIVLEDAVAGDLWPVKGNPTQIHQIFLNLVVNARDAMLPRGGTLRVEAHNCLLDPFAVRDIEGGRAGAFLLIKVTDTGTGIPPAVLKRIWEPFYTTKGEGKGTGLGLSTVRGIVTTHGGFITVETRPDHGTTFSVYLPVAEGVGLETAAPTAPILPRGSGETVMIVDDDEAIRVSAAAILTHHGYRVINAADGVEAIGLFTQHATEVRLVISDQNMPNLNGEALARVLRRLQPEVKILAMTGFGSSNEPGEVNAPLPRLQKPFTADTLVCTVHKLIASNSS